MNLAFTREIAPAMYFLLMGHSAAAGSSPGRGIATPGDDYGTPFPSTVRHIWCGIIASASATTWATRCVRLAHVLHERASDPFVNLRKEAAAIGENEHLWRRVDAIRSVADRRGVLR